MKRVIALSSAFAVTAAVALQAQNVSGPAPAQDPPRLVNITLEARTVKGLPYSAEMVTESLQTLTDGNRIVQRTTGRIYRDAEGRVRREEARGAGGLTISITDPVAHTSYTLDPATRTARATPSLESYMLALDDLVVRLEPNWTKREKLDSAGVAPPPTGQLRGAGGGGRGRGGRNDTRIEEKLPDQMMEGVLASGVRRTTTIERGAIGNEQPIRIVSEEWTSNELRVLVMTDLTDPRTGRSTYRLLRINRAEPDPALFQVPPDYTVQNGRGGSAPPAGAGGRGRGRG